MIKLQFVSTSGVSMSLNVEVPWYFFDIESSQMMQMVSVAQRDHGGVELNVVSDVQLFDHGGVLLKASF